MFQTKHFNKAYIFLTKKFLKFLLRGMDPVRQASVAMFVQPGSMALVAVWLCQCS